MHDTDACVAGAEVAPAADGDAVPVSVRDAQNVHVVEAAFQMAASRLGQAAPAPQQPTADVQTRAVGKYVRLLCSMLPREVQVCNVHTDGSKLQPLWCCRVVPATTPEPYPRDLCCLWHTFKHPLLSGHGSACFIWHTQVSLSFSFLFREVVPGVF